MTPGTHSLDARVIVQHRFRSEPFVGPFTAALLTSPPTPEGSGGIELVAPGYMRPVVEFGPPAVRVLDAARRSARRVSFGAVGYDAGQAKWVAIYDSIGMLAYGRAQRCVGTVEPGEIAFDGGRIRLRF